MGIFTRHRVRKHLKQDYKREQAELQKQAIAQPPADTPQSADAPQFAVTHQTFDPYSSAEEYQVIETQPTITTQNQDARNDDVFRREENPALFDIVRHVLVAKYKAGFHDKEGNYHPPQEVQFGDSLYGETLDLCNELNLNAYQGALNSLEGIGHLQNLEAISCSGYDELNGKFCYEKIQEFSNIENSTDSNEMTEEEFLDGAKKKYESKQIYDITPLYSCKKLKRIGLNNQAHIIEFDVGQFPHLRILGMQNCEKLTYVTGFNYLKDFEKIFCDQATADAFWFDFSGSENLRELPYLISILDMAKQQSPKVDYKRPVFAFPLNTFIRLANKGSTATFLQDYVQFKEQNPRHDLINWTENSSSTKCGWNTRQAMMLKSRMDEITNTVCQKGEDTMLSLLNVYQWITTNVVYDHAGLYRENSIQNLPEYIAPFETTNNQFHYYSQEHIDQKSDLIAELQATAPALPYVDIAVEVGQGYALMRSAFVALFNQKTVCAGVSNLFNAFAVNLGVDAQSCYCYAKKGNETRKYGNGLNHQISIINSLVNGEPSTTVFDPTQDMFHSGVAFFGLGREDADKYYEMGVKHFDSVKGESLLGWLKQNYHNCWLKQQKSEVVNDIYEQHQACMADEKSNAEALQRDFVKKGLDKSAKQTTEINPEQTPNSQSTEPQSTEQQSIKQQSTEPHSADQQPTPEPQPTEPQMSR